MPFGFSHRWPILCDQRRQTSLIRISLLRDEPKQCLRGGYGFLCEPFTLRLITGISVIIKKNAGKS